MLPLLPTGMHSSFCFRYFPLKEGTEEEGRVEKQVDVIRPGRWPGRMVNGGGGGRPGAFSVGKLVKKTTGNEKECQRRQNVSIIVIPIEDLSQKFFAYKSNLNGIRF